MKIAIVAIVATVLLVFLTLLVLRRGRPLDPKELARRLGVKLEELQLLQPQYYRVRIDKRSGGQRELHVPDDATKALQRRVLRRLLARLVVHDAACGFESGRSIVDNARPHVGQAVVIRLDVVDFFPNTLENRLRTFYRRIGWDEEATEILLRLTTYQGCLPQGAPTSPRLSNLVNFRLDAQMSNLARGRGGVYTRYADDITFSFPVDDGKQVRGIIQLAARILASKGYQLQRRKTQIRRRHQRQMVTGLVVNDGVQLPRKTRRWLRSVQHRIKRGRRATLTQEQLNGWLAFERMVDRG